MWNLFCGTIKCVWFYVSAEFFVNNSHCFLTDTWKYFFINNNLKSQAGLMCKLWLHFFLMWANKILYLYWVWWHAGYNSRAWGGWSGRIMSSMSAELYSETLSQNKLRARDVAKWQSVWLACARQNCLNFMFYLNSKSSLMALQNMGVLCLTSKYP
jgi:hypothetical protein